MIPDRVTIREKYEPALKITDPVEGEIYLEECVQHLMRTSPNLSREDAIEIEKANLAYYSTYYSTETREQVERVFGAIHPLLGKSADSPTDPNEYIKLGAKLAEKILKNEN